LKLILKSSVCNDPLKEQAVQYLCRWIQKDICTYYNISKMQFLREDPHHNIQPNIIAN